MEVKPSVPFINRPEKFLLFPCIKPSFLWLPAQYFEFQWKRLVKIIGPEYVAEFLGTMIFITFALGGVAQAYFSTNDVTSWIQGAWGAAIGIFFGMYTCLGVSGGHLNPAVTFSMAVIGRFSWVKVPIYWIAQFLGSFIASVIVFLYYQDAIWDYRLASCEFNQDNETYRIWTTNPLDSVRNSTIFWDQFFSSFLLLFLILAIFDRPNSGLVHYLKPVGVSLIIFAVSICFAYNCGGAMNPIRDFPPRCFAAIFWGHNLFTLHSYYFWIPLIAPLLGGPAGGIIYIFFIETHHYPASGPIIACKCLSKFHQSQAENGISENDPLNTSNQKNNGINHNY